MIALRDFAERSNKPDWVEPNSSDETARGVASPSGNNEQNV
jgi:hypothetical protein